MSSEGINRLEDMKNESISNLKPRLVESNQGAQEKEKIIFKMRIGYETIANSIMHTNVCIIGVPRRRRERKDYKTYLNKY